MKLYVIRHGESVGNKQDLHQNAQTPLSETGIFQAGELAHRFENIDIDVIIASPFERTKQTAEAIGQRKNLDVVYDKRIVEVKRPTEIEGKNIYEPEVMRIKDSILEHIHEPDWYYSDEEKPKDILDRVKSFLDDLQKREEETILLVTHGDVIKSIMLLLMYKGHVTNDIWLHAKDFYWLNNTGITVFITYEGAWKLLTWNDHAHLG